MIRESCGLVDFHDVAEEARRFLSLPRAEPESDYRPHLSPAPTGSPESARRLFAMSKPIAGTVVETYLRQRGITDLHDICSLRFHPRCYYRPEADAPTETWPAMIAAVTDLRGHITGAHRTWLDPSGRDKAPVDTPRRAMGHLLGHAVRFGSASDVMAAGEGIETMLSLRCVIPGMAMVAALSAAHLAAILFPAALRRLYIVRDDDRAGDGAMKGLIDRTRQAGIEAIVLSPQCGDFNEDLRNFDINTLRAALRVQLTPEDVARFLSTSRSNRNRGGGCVLRRDGALSILGASPLAGEDRAHGLLERATLRQAVRPRNGGSRLFSVAPPRRRFTSRSKIVGSRHPPLRYGRCRCARRCRSGPPAAFRRHEGRDERGQSDKGKPP